MANWSRSSAGRSSGWWRSCASSCFCREGTTGRMFVSVCWLSTVALWERSMLSSNSVRFVSWGRGRVGYLDIAPQGAVLGFNQLKGLRQLPVGERCEGGVTAERRNRLAQPLKLERVGGLTVAGARPGDAANATPPRCEPSSVRTTDSRKLLFPHPPLLSAARVRENWFSVSPSMAQPYQMACAASTQRG